MQLLEVLGGFLRTQALHTVARLGVADLVGEEPVRVEELAARVDADPSALHRVMRLLASLGIFSGAESGAFVATPLSDGLREDHPASVRYGKLLDLIMLLLLGGKERTRGEWPARLREGGFELVGVTPGPLTSLIEAAPA